MKRLNRTIQVTAGGVVLMFAVASSFGQTQTWTTTQDFAGGESVNLNATTVTDQLQVNTWAETKASSPPVAPYLWVALSARSTVIRVATADHWDPIQQRNVTTGEILGEYSTAPDGCRVIGNNVSGPSRTGVDFDGGVWVGNRNNVNSPSQGHLVKIGNGTAFQWIDRNNNGVIDTSNGYGDIRPWTNDDGVCDASDVQFAADELILLYQPVPGTETRTVAVDRANNVWVGGAGGFTAGDEEHGLLDGRTGDVIEGCEFATAACGGYGGAVDCNGVLWSVSRPIESPSVRLLRYDPGAACSNPISTAQCIAVAREHGVALDLEGAVWISRWLDARVTKLAPNGSFLGDFPSGGGESRGVVVLPDDDSVWIANSLGDNVARLTNAGVLVATVDQGTASYPTGVAVDSTGFIWAVNRDADTITRIDPATNAIDQTINLPLLPFPEDPVSGQAAGPYDVTDMTGVNLYHTISPAGVWTDVYDSGASGTIWGTATWTETLGHANSTVRLSARAADVETDLGKKKYLDVQNGVRFTCAQCDAVSFPDCDVVVGRYIQVRVQLNAFCHQQAWPTLQDLTVQADPTGQDCQPNGIPDECDLVTGNSPDCNADSVPDECQVPPICMTCSDCDANGVPDACDPDCNGNQVADACDIASGASQDCNSNGKPDECDIADGTSQDCNANAIPDECDLAAGSSCDVNVDGVPDECQPAPGDCNENGINDTCERVCGAVGGPCDVPGCGTGIDCNDNCTLDVCEIDQNSSAPGGPFFCTSNCDEDCNDNGVPDECDITDGTSTDCRGGEGDCCTVHPAPGCSNFEIESEVCGFFNDPCCTTSWDAVCVQLAESSQLGCAVPDAVPDECQLVPVDCNGNGINDTCDVSCGVVGGTCDVPGCGTATDCNDNCTLDVCEIDENSSAPGGPFFCTSDCAADCNDNGVPDDCDVPPICATCPDCNSNSVPDVCDADCNANSVPDDCDLAAGSSCDVDEDGVPDECGACCEDSVCRDSMSWLCQFGDFADGVACVGSSCRIGSCCLGSTCRDDLNKSQCEAIPGSVFSIVLFCSPNPCSNGACCLSNGQCLIGSESFCAIENGTFFGSASCTPGLCDAPIVDCDNDCVGDSSGRDAVLTDTSYACDDTLSRIMRNVLRFQFACPVTLPLAGEVEIRELLADGALGPDLSDRFDFTLEGTAGFETILRIEEDGCRGGTCDFGAPAVCEGGLDDTLPCGQVFVNETWYAVLNSGNWVDVAAFQVDYASVYGDADNFGGTNFNDLNAIFNNMTSECSDDSRFDIDAFGCVNFNDLNAAFTYIGSAAPAKPSGHDCSGSSQQSQGGGSGSESSSLTVSTTLETTESSPTTFVAWLPDFVSEVEVPEFETYDGLGELLRELAAWAVENLTTDQRDTVASALSDPLRTFADPIVAAKAQDMADLIAP